jgi:hypothetical protein
MALGSCSTDASCSRLVDEHGPAPSTGGRGRASTWQLQLSHRPVRASTDEQRTGYARGVAIVHQPNKMRRCAWRNAARRAWATNALADATATKIACISWLVLCDSVPSVRSDSQG